MVQTNFWKFCQACRTAQKGVAGQRPFLLQNYYRRTVEYFCMISFASTRHGPELIFKKSSMLDCPKGRGRATPYFRIKYSIHSCRLICRKCDTTNRATFTY